MAEESTPDNKPKDEPPSEKFRSPDELAQSNSDNEQTDKAVEDIQKEESDDQLAKADAKNFNPPAAPWYKKIFKGKKIWIPLVIILILALLAAIPWIRYKLAGLVVKKNFVVQVTDSQTGKPVSDADVTLDGKSTETNNQGQASLKVSLGSGRLTISKKYYNSASSNVFVGFRSSSHVYKLVANGRQVPVTVINKITGKPISGAVVLAAGTKAETDSQGKVTIVLPANAATVAASISASGYNPISIKLQVTTSATANSFQLTPAGKVYFLSNASGKIDVVSTNLDGSGRQTVLAGTGQEDPRTTNLTASHDWKYLALLSSRSGAANPALYLISTSSGAVSTINDGVSLLSLVGWIGHDLIYTEQATASSHKSGDNKIISYDADTGKSVTLSSSRTTGTTSLNTMYQTFWNVLIFNGKVVYTVNWNSVNTVLTATGTDYLVSLNPDGSGQRVIKTLDATNQYFGDMVVAEPNQLDVVIYGTGSNSSASYYAVNSSFAISLSNTITNNNFNQAQTFIPSPSGDQMFWADVRDGKNTLLVGSSSSDGTNATQIATNSSYQPYGWFTDSYLLVGKDSALYVMPASGGNAVTISNFYQSVRGLQFDDGYSD